MLLGTLLVAILAAHRRHVHQVSNAKARLAAVAAADRLLEKWRVEGIWGPTSSSGTFQDSGALAWRWTITTPVELRGLGAAKGRLEVFKRDSTDESPLLAVELVTGSVIRASGQGI